MHAFLLFQWQPVSEQTLFRRPDMSLSTQKKYPKYHQKKRQQKESLTPEDLHRRRIRLRMCRRLLRRTAPVRVWLQIRREALLLPGMKRSFRQGRRSRQMKLLPARSRQMSRFRIRNREMKLLPAQSRQMKWLQIRSNRVNLSPNRIRKMLLPLQRRTAIRRKLPLQRRTAIRRKHLLRMPSRSRPMKRLLTMSRQI